MFNPNPNPNLNPTGWIVSNGVGLLSHCFVLLFSFVASTLVQRTVVKPHKGYCSFWPPIMFNPNPNPNLNPTGWIVSNGVGLLSHCFVLLFSFVASTLVQRTVLKPHKCYCSFWPPIMFNPNPNPNLNPTGWIVSNCLGLLSHCFVLLFSKP